MKQIKIKTLDENVYYEKLENGLDVYIYKKTGFQKKSVFFQTKYGSLNNEFVPLGKDTMKSFPLGIAHFLEHKLFESEDNSNVFEEFEKNGAYVNAATSFDKTYYFFSGTDHFYDNLKLLINMVQNPYFTDENVNKEKGIINQEIAMYENDADQVIYDKLFYNSIVNHPLRYSIAGTKKSVDLITKEDLYECYNTFYNPSNMFLVVAGDVDENEVVTFIKNIEKEKSFKENDKIINKKYDEPKEVYKKEEVFYHNVVADKTGYAYKILLPKLDNKEEYIRGFYTWVFMASKFDKISGFTEKLIKEGLVKSYFDSDYVIKDNILMIFFLGDVTDVKKVGERVEKELKDFSNLEEKFNLYKKSNIAGCVKKFEVPDKGVGTIRDLVSKYDTIFEDLIGIYKNASYSDYIKYLKTLNFDNKTMVTAKRKDDKDA